MSIDFAGDLAAIYAVGEFAQTVRYVHSATGGPTFTLPVIFDAPDEFGQTGLVGVVGQKRIARAQAASFALPPARDDTMVVGDDILTVRAARRSIDRLEWFLDVSL